MRKEKDLEEKLYDFEVKARLPLRQGNQWLAPVDRNFKPKFLTGLVLTRNWILEVNSAETLALPCTRRCGALQEDYTGMKEFLQKIGSSRRLVAGTL
jgi:hypothetical protein